MSRAPAAAALTAICATTLIALLPATAAAKGLGGLGPHEAKDAKSSHAAFEDGDCSICHKRADAKNPGPVRTPINDVCFECHDDFPDMMKKFKVQHGALKKGCTGCHNPHNSPEVHLLRMGMPGLCLRCHDGIQKKMNLPVKHNALTDGAACANCHEPHASNVEKLLKRLPFDLCVNCHSKDKMTDESGNKLTNIKDLLDKNKVHHSPVADKDCSACHTPHGGEKFRLLIESYPAKFYSGFSAGNYALCFGCHDEEAMRAPETTSATNFRHGKRNLHYLHVNKAERGRTCRACHEVHASKQAFQLRDGVPYGKKGWILKMNFSKNPNGGTCAKTCHAAKTYVNRKGK